MCVLFFLVWTKSKKQQQGLDGRTQRNKYCKTHPPRGTIPVESDRQAAARSVRMQPLAAPERPSERTIIRQTETAVTQADLHQQPTTRRPPFHCSPAARWHRQLTGRTATRACPRRSCCLSAPADGVGLLSRWRAFADRPLSGVVCWSAANWETTTLHAIGRGQAGAARQHVERMGSSAPPWPSRTACR